MRAALIKISLIKTFEGLSLSQKPILDNWSQHTHLASDIELPFPNEVGSHPSANVTPLLGHRPEELHTSAHVLH